MRRLDVGQTQGFVLSSTAPSDEGANHFTNLCGTWKDTVDLGQPVPYTDNEKR